MRRLLIRPGAIGDCILSFPALKFLKADYTELWISSPVVPLVQFADRVRSIASTCLDMVLDKVEEPIDGFDEVVSWYGTNRPEFRKLFPHWTFLEALPNDQWQGHATDFFLQQVGAPPGAVPRIEIEAVEKRRSVVIHPFSGSARKNWPLNRYQELARKPSLPVEWTAGPDEVLENAQRFDNLLDLARWMAGASLYIGNDSGISHLAAAIGVPSIVLFRSTSPTTWAPRGDHVLPFLIGS